MVATITTIISAIVAIIGITVGLVIKWQRDTITDQRADDVAKDARIAELERRDMERRAEIERLSTALIAEQRAHLKTQVEMQASIDALTEQMRQVTQELRDARSEITELRQQIAQMGGGGA